MLALKREPLHDLQVDPRAHRSQARSSTNERDARTSYVSSECEIVAVTERRVTVEVPDANRITLHPVPK